MLFTLCKSQNLFSFHEKGRTHEAVKCIRYGLNMIISRWYFFVDHFNSLVLFSLVFVMLWRLYIAALWSPAGKGLTSWLLTVILSLSNVVSWVRRGT